MLMRATTIVRCVFPLLGLLNGYAAAQVGLVSEYTSSTTFTVPAGVTAVTVEAWGAGGGGGNSGGGGGGGGAYATGTVSVTPGASVAITVGTSAAATAGGASSFGTAVSAGGGAAGTNAGGSGGAVIAGTGTAGCAGGAPQSGGSSRGGGGGGGAASSSGTCTAGGAGTATVGGTAGTGATGGGNGGAGGAPGAVGSPGGTYGGGGGGGGRTAGNNQAGAAGGGGRVILRIAPTVSISFSPSTINSGQASVMTVTLTNPNSAAITGVAFTDTYPSGMTNTASPAAATTCSGGSATATANGGSLTFSGGTIPGSGSCTVTVNVTATSTVTNDIASVTTGNAGTAASSSATLTVNPLDRIRISSGTGATGLTCAALTLTIAACADSTCSSFYNQGVSGTLTATGSPTVVWDGTTGGASGAGFVIPNGSTSVTKKVQVATAGAVVFGANSLTQTPSNGVTCDFGSPSCTFTASTAGFLFTSTATGTTAATIPTLTAGTAAGSTYYLRAIDASNNAAVCTPAIVGQSNVDVTLGYTCNDPSSCQSGQNLLINSTAVPAAGTTVPLNFDANGSAPLSTLRYDDAGKITLTASKVFTPFTGATDITLSGSSNTFVVAPSHFELSSITCGATANPAASDANGSVFCGAGSPFSMTVTARNALGNATPNFGKEASPATVTLTPAWTSGLGLTGTPVLSGSFGSFGSGAATGSNFKLSDVGIITVTPSISNYLASGANVSGTATGNIGRFVPNAFRLETSGTNMPTSTQRADISGAYSAAGATVVSTTAGSAVVTAASANGFAVGDSVVVIGQGSGGKDLATTVSSLSPFTLAAAMNSTATGVPLFKRLGFTYLGEPLTLAFKLSAVDADGNVTPNYQGSFAKLTTTTDVVRAGTLPAATATWGLWAAGEHIGGTAGCRALFSSAAGYQTTISGCTPTGWPTSPYNAAAARVAVSGAVTAPSWSSGVGTFSTRVVIGRATQPDGPYNVDQGSMAIGIAPQDSDGVQLASTALNLDTDTTAGNDRARVVFSDQRFGRLQLFPGYGSEQLTSVMPMQVEYWNGTAFVLNGSDTATTVGSALVTVSGWTGGGTAPTFRDMYPAAFTGGVSALRLNPSSPVAAGRATVTLGLSANSLGYLQGQLAGNSTYTSDPSAPLVLGTFKRSNKVIFSQERY